MSATLTNETNQEDFIATITEVAQRLGFTDATHYTANAEHYWKNKAQFISVLSKNLPDDRLKVIFQQHIQRIANPPTPGKEGKQTKDEPTKDQVNPADLYGGDEFYHYRNEKRLVYENMVKLQTTRNFSIYSAA